MIATEKPADRLKLKFWLGGAGGIAMMTALYFLAAKLGQGKEAQEFMVIVAVMALVLAAEVVKRKEAVAGLRAWEQRYRNLFENSPQPMWIYNYETLRFLAVNQAATEHYGYSRGEFLGLRLADLRPPEDLMMRPDPLSTAGVGQRQVRVRHRRKNGTLMDLEITRHELVFDGHPAVMLSGNDITHRKRMERRMTAFALLGRRLSGARTTREAGQIIAVTAKVLFGWDIFAFELCTPDKRGLQTVLWRDMSGRWQETPGEPADGSLEPIRQRVFAVGAQLVLRTAPGDLPSGAGQSGETAPSASLMFVPLRKLGGPIGILSIQSRSPRVYDSEDLRTFQALADHCGAALDRIRAEAAVRKSDESLRLAMAAARMGTWTIELGSPQPISLSPNLEEIFGLKPREFDGTEASLIELIYNDDREQIRQFMAKASVGHEAEAEFRILPRERPMGWLLIRGQTYRDAQHKPARVAGIAIDVTAHKIAEQEVRRLNAELERRVHLRTAQLQTANKELETFSYSVSHDLRAPLRSVQGFCEVLQQRYADKLDARGQGFLRRVCDSTVRMNEMIEELLQLSRVGRSAIRRQPVCLSALAEAVAAELRESQPDRKVRWQIAPDLMAQGDERLLRLVLQNLLGNAWKFTGRQPKPQIEFGFGEEPQAAFFVRDNGAGFDMAYANKLFGVFQRLHSTSEFPGTGIGLATVQRIIHRHDGRVWASSTAGQGASFFFTLPASEASWSELRSPTLTTS